MAEKAPETLFGAASMPNVNLSGASLLFSNGFMKPEGKQWMSRTEVPSLYYE